MNEPMFTPAASIIIFRGSEENPDMVDLNDTATGNTIVNLKADDIASWSDIKILAYAYLRALVLRDTPMNDPYHERIFGMLTDTVKSLGQDDFLTKDWEGVKVELNSQLPSGPIYVAATTKDGYDITLSYTTPGMPWQTVEVSHQDLIPSPEELYKRLMASVETEWSPGGTVVFDGLVYNYDIANGLTSSKTRLQIQHDGGGMLYTDDDVALPGMINAMLELHRKMLLRMEYGDIGAMTGQNRELLQNNLYHVLNNMMGMQEYTNLLDGVNATIRVNVGNIPCMVTHTFVEAESRIRVDYRFFTMDQTWFIDHSQSFEFTEEITEAGVVYERNFDRINLALGITPLPDAVFGNNKPSDGAIVEQSKIALIVAIGPKNGIGMGNDLLFRIKEDMKFFRETTTDHIVIMGRKTYESIGKPLPNRINIVISRDPEYVLNMAAADGETYDNLHCVTSKEEALLLAYRLNLSYGDNRDVFVIGGAAVYDQFMENASKIIMTMVNSDDSHADVFFPLTSDEVRANWLAEQVEPEKEMVAEDGTTYTRWVLTRNV